MDASAPKIKRKNGNVIAWGYIKNNHIFHGRNQKNIFDPDCQVFQAIDTAGKQPRPLPLHPSLGATEVVATLFWPHEAETGRGSRLS